MGIAFRGLCRRHGAAGQGGRGACGLKPGDGAAHQRGGGVCVGHCAGAGQARRDSLARPAHVLFLALSGLATGLSWICYFRALQLGPASRVAPLDKLSVPLVMVFAWLLLGEKLTRRRRGRAADHRGRDGDGAGISGADGRALFAYTQKSRYVDWPRKRLNDCKDRIRRRSAGSLRKGEQDCSRAAADCADRIHGLGQEHGRPLVGGAAGMELYRCGRRD